ncbi:hypothetical protein [Alishewanella phage vB_AspM_Slicko01]|nr:hypothetical protein [Alishewanella phage vB_AspM_Slicko01]
MGTIICNGIRCPDGTLLVSKHRHDFQSHTQEDGRRYAVDGGDYYRRICASDSDYDPVVITIEDPHYMIRDLFFWTSTLDADGNTIAPITKPISALTDSHIKALVDYTASDYPDWVNTIFRNELNFRNL